MKGNNARIADQKKYEREREKENVFEVTRKWTKNNVIVILPKNVGIINFVFRSTFSINL